MVVTKLMKRENLAPMEKPFLPTRVEVCMRKEGQIDPNAKPTIGFIRN